jgi:arabinose-5-phosphate isomerase
VNEAAGGMADAAAAALSARAEAQRVLRAEADALERLASSLGDDFDAAVHAIEAVVGRVVCTGIGKSGHVARKIAATLASTGTPASFVHPAEASHGDLGMIGLADLVLAISASGETAELSDVLYFARRHDIPIIAVTRSATSRLATAAKVVLLLPDVAEACPLNLAPMTSTTATMALGDALAAALMRRRGFSAAGFRSFHPGGRLGAQLLTAADIMHRGAELPLVNRAATIQVAVQEMSAKRFGCVGIIDNAGTLCGIFTDGDLRRRFGSASAADPVTALMTSDPQRIGPETLAVDAARLMERRGLPSLFVVDRAGHPVGLIHLHDLLRARLA